MMSNLFSSFDPTTTVFSLNWLSTLMILVFIPNMFWFIPSRISLAWTKLMLIMNKEIKVLIPNFKYKGINLMLISMFMFIMVNNFMGLFPYIFTSTSHMVITLSLALPLWISLMLYGWMNNTLTMFAHLVPLGTPKLLMPFMVCIESISNIIRPGTLAVRLSANMIAGHLLLTLLGSIGSSISTWMISFLVLVQILLLFLEMAVSLIQSYVFIILATLYSSEVN
uniref:ATP synthase F0 subunit 6 n=1 Tax=Basiprionota bisignata TaxID=2873934 RepID=UPI001F140457|nr:ATP synthase F0 subunit 6 [Basiprionota bisignata]UKS07052.1 ATP synthase F0 subunit 6 [Basiprionota bisignata]